MARIMAIVGILLAMSAAACRDGPDSPGPSDDSSFENRETGSPEDTASASPVPSPSVTATVRPESSPPATTTARPDPVSEPGQPGPYAPAALVLGSERETRDGQARRIDTVVWYPTREEGAIDPSVNALRDVEAAEGGPFPLVLFSHGDGGNPLQSTFLTSHLATHGFIVAAVSHTGTALRQCFPCIDLEGADASFEERLLDISAALTTLVDATNQRGSLRGAIDVDRAAIVGHSFGGYTTLLSLSEGGAFQAGVALAPVELDLEDSQLEDINAPVLIMGAGLDDTAPFRVQEQLYEDLDDAASKILVELPRGGHLGFTDYCFPRVPGCERDAIDPDVARAAVNYYVTAFLQLFLKGDEASTELLAEDFPGARVVDADGLE